MNNPADRAALWAIPHNQRAVPPHGDVRVALALLGDGSVERRKPALKAAAGAKTVSAAVIGIVRQ
jgi:hypothetical protein